MSYDPTLPGYGMPDETWRNEDGETLRVPVGTSSVLYRVAGFVRVYDDPVEHLELNAWLASYVNARPP